MVWIILLKYFGNGKKIVIFDGNYLGIDKYDLFSYFEYKLTIII